MTEPEYDHLEDAFRCVFLDMVGHGCFPYSERALQALWLDFLVDMASGFPSITLGKRYGGQQ